MSGVATSTMGQTLREAIRHALSQVNTCMVARVESFDASRQTVTVTPAVQTTYRDDGDSDIAEPLPTLPSVPYMPAKHLARAAEAGDWVLLLFAQRSLDTWLTQGGVNVDPRDPRMFDLSDAVAIPLMFGPAPDTLTADLVVEVGTSKLTLTTGGVVRQGVGGGHAAVAEKVLAELQKLGAALSALSADMTALSSAVGIGAVTASALSLLGIQPVPAGPVANTWPGDVNAPNLEVTP